jgi:hypothetical protein
MTKRKKPEIEVWADIDTSSRELLYQSFGQQRRAILETVRELNAAIEWFNKHRSPNDQIEMSFNFDECLNEDKAYNEKL